MCKVDVAKTKEKGMWNRVYTMHFCFVVIVSSVKEGTQNEGDLLVSDTRTFIGVAGKLAGRKEQVSY